MIPEIKGQVGFGLKAGRFGLLKWVGQRCKAGHVYNLVY